MWTNRDRSYSARGFSTPPASASNARPQWSSGIPHSEPAKRGSDPFHVIHKVPAGDSPYVKAKHVQLIDKDPSKAISLFWAAINSGDRVDSALKDMAIVMKQLDRSDEAIEAIKSFRHLCPHESQEPLDNILLELYKRSGRIEDQIKMLEIKVKSMEQGFSFGGKRVKPARSQGRKIYMTIEQEYSRLLGNLAWAYMQNNDFKSAEEHYRKALSLEPDKNKQCNLAICLMHMKRITEGKLLLQTIRVHSYENGKFVNDESYARSLERATEMLNQLESNSSTGYPCPSPVIQTQPRRCSGSIKGGDKRRSFLGDDSRCARKLAFGEYSDVSRENEAKNEENVGKGNYFSTPKSKNSWADMAEEEEERRSCKEMPLSFQTQPREEFNNENSDSNVMIVAPVNERGEFWVNSNLVSSLANFVEDERVDEYYDCGNGITMLKRSSKRLQVFRDITSTSESRRGI